MLNEKELHFNADRVIARCEWKLLDHKMFLACARITENIIGNGLSVKMLSA